MIAGPSYTFGLNLAMFVAVDALSDREFKYSSAGLIASLFSRLIGTALSQTSLAFLILSCRVSSSRTSISFCANRPTSLSNSLDVYGTVSLFSNIFGFSPPRLKPDPIVALISTSFKPMLLAAVCKSVIARSMTFAPRCACLPSV